ncbi:CYTH-like domain-containing protein [Fennellomyces sp. T-0311]|nr:CYTH-like domain-containing protein [Fennellomyces sp. T-0311]
MSKRTADEMKNGRGSDERDVPSPTVKRQASDSTASFGPSEIKSDGKRSPSKKNHQKDRDQSSFVPASKESNDVPTSKAEDRHYQIVPTKEPTIFCTRPVDDIVLYIADLLKDHCDKDHVEIEAKLGVFIDKQTHQRINMGAVTETGIIRFEASMPLKQHKHFNELLNRRVEKSNKRDYKGERIRYAHTYEIDSFHSGNSSRDEKWRVTRDQRTGELKPGGIIEKQRVMNINVHVPKQPLDYRISINLELPRPKPTGPVLFTRQKDRVSYKHAGIQFDLTQVTGGPHKDNGPSHELELEIINPSELAKAKGKEDRREPSQYNEMVESFVNNVRMLCRSALKIPHYEK